MDQRTNEEILEEFQKQAHFMETNFDEVYGDEFYQFLFPNNERVGEMNTDFSKPNAIYLYKDHSSSRLKRRIMLKDTWEEDFIKYVEGNEMALCSGLAFVGKENKLERATKCNALIFDIDGVMFNNLKNIIGRFSHKNTPRSIPYPQFLALSGTGVHLYYVFDQPIDLYPHIKTQLKALKYDLTRRFWDYGGTSTIKNIQYQSISQNFRMVGSINSKYGNPILAYRISEEKTSLEHLNQFVLDEKNKVDITRKFAPSRVTLEEAKKRYPEWYERVIIRGEEVEKKWSVKRDVYDWWRTKKIHEAVGGHRYYFMMCQAIYAVKCDIPRDEFERDLRESFEFLKQIEHHNELTEDDFRSALEMYDKTYYRYSIDTISKISAIPIERNKRNYRSQKEHVKIMSAIRDVIYPNGEWRNKNGRPKGSGTKRELVVNYIKEHPNATVTEIAKALNVSRTTVYKYRNMV